MSKILFISHFADRTGAPILLLNLIKYLKSHHNISPVILVLEKGPLIAEFKKLGKLFCLKIDKPFRVINKVVNRVIPGFSSEMIKRKLIRNLKVEEIDLIYANTVVSLEIGAYLKSALSKPLILHVHELITIIEAFSRNFKVLSHHVDHFIVVSKAVKKTLHMEYSISNHKIDLIYGFIDSLSFIGKKKENHRRKLYSRGSRFSALA